MFFLKKTIDNWKVQRKAGTEAGKNEEKHTKYNGIPTQCQENGKK